MFAPVRLLSRLALDLFYRRRVLGRSVPGSGPVVLVANHPNGLLDAAAVMLLTERRVRFLGKEPLFAIPGFGALLRAMGTLPVHRAIDGADTADNQHTFQAVFEALQQGEVVCLFPEGISHSEPALQKLKTGAARMALGAEALARGTLSVVVVPVGLVYGRKDRFRSTLAASVGEPIEVRTGLELFRADERSAVGELTARIAQGLRRVMLELDGWEDLPLLELAERIWPRDGSDPVERMRLFADGLRRLRAGDPDRAAELAHRVALFRDRLELLGLSVGDLDVRYSPMGVVRFTLRNGFLLGIALPLAVLGAAFWWLPYRAVGWISGWKSVQIDIVATQRVAVGIVVFAVWLLLAGVAALMLGGPWWACGTLALAPGAGVVTLRFGDRFRAVAGDALRFFRFARKGSLKARLAERRDELASDFAAVQEHLLRATGSP